jgi:hypothetical protein
LDITLAAAVLTAHIILVASGGNTAPLHITLVASVVNYHRAYYIGLQRLFSNPRVIAIVTITV